MGTRIAKYGLGLSESMQKHLWAQSIIIVLVLCLFYSKDFDNNLFEFLNEPIN